MKINAGFQKRSRQTFISTLLHLIFLLLKVLIKLFIWTNHRLVKIALANKRILLELVVSFSSLFFIEFELMNKEILLGNSASMMDHYYYKLLQIAVFKPDVVKNKYLVHEASQEHTVIYFLKIKTLF